MHAVVISARHVLFRRDLDVAGGHEGTNFLQRLGANAGDAAELFDLPEGSFRALVEDAAGRVQVTDSSGDVVIRGAREVVVPSDSSGSIRITQVTGNVRIENDSSGDVSVSDIGGAFELVADSSGDVAVSDVKGTVTVPPRD